MYFMMQMMSYFRSKPVPNVNPVADSSKAGAVAHGGVPGNLFPKGTFFDLYVYIGESDGFDDFENERSLYFSSKSIEYGDWKIGENSDGVISYPGAFELTTV
jgi:hypothetical protein